MAKQLKKHICNDTCKGRTNTINCFMCSELFFAKCFAIDTPTQTKINTIDSCVRFICGKCQSNMNENKRKSMSHSQSSTPKTADNNNQKQNDNINKILEILSMQTPSISSTSNATVVNSNGNDNDDRKNAQRSKSDDHSHKFLTEQFDLTRSTLDNIFKLIIKLDDKMDKLHTNEGERISMQQITKLFVDNNKNSSIKPPVSKARNGLDWSAFNESLNIDDGADGRQSIFIRQTMDDSILDILKNSESTTWNTLDHLSKEVRLNGEIMLNELKKNNEKLDHLIDIHPINRVPFSNQISSPLVDAINISNSSDNNDHETVSTVTDDQTMNADQSRSLNLATGNPPVMNQAQKEVITQQKDDLNDPETPNSTWQKRHMPSSSDGGLSNDQLDSTQLQNERQIVTTTTMSPSAATVEITPTNSASYTDAHNSTPAMNSTAMETDALAAMSSLDTFDNEIYVTKCTNSTTCEDIKMYLRN